VVRAPQSPATRHLGRFLLDGKAYACALGKAGITGNKCEGDSATPCGPLPIVSGRFRSDRAHKPFGYESFWQRIKPEDGWCDAAFTPAYNKPVSLPHPHAHEVMTREDHLYDRLIILDWNMSRRAHRRGSAIFLHQARIEDHQMRGTEGCVALEARVFAKLAPRLAQLTAIHVV
jgi:L,D-peptidoglycan transpeptidase YkuD (ErfK/YbiS/YcfS/YnhG family)